MLPSLLFFFLSLLIFFIFTETLTVSVKKNEKTTVNIALNIFAMELTFLGEKESGYKKKKKRKRE